MSEESCPFCAIVAKRLPGSLIYEDADIAAFMDTRPINPGHALVVPVRHAADLSELDSLVGSAMFSVARTIALGLERGALADLNVRCEGVNLLLSDGAAAGQVVGHVHLHVVPRYRGDGFGFRRRGGAPASPARTVLDSMARALAAAIQENKARPPGPGPIDQMQS